ncbi:MAG: Ldh family oxidoreductase [Alphaproteobacteria bacterium]
MTITAANLQDFLTRLLQAGGFTAEEAARTAESLVLSNLAGHDSHGAIRAVEYLSYYRQGFLASGVPLNMVAETPSSLTVDAQKGLGQVQIPRLIEKLLQKSTHHGVVTGSIMACGHVGRLGEWVEYIAASGMASFMAVNDDGNFACVAPPGGRVGCTSTNPLAFGIPLDAGEVFTIDLSTSTVALGKMRLAAMAGQECAAGLIQDHDGQPSTNPAILFQEPAGAILPMAGYKGFALSMIVDCLVSGLSGGITPPGPAPVPMLTNALITIWNPALFSGLPHMQFQARKYMNYLRENPPIDPQQPIRLPGDRANKEKRTRQQQGIPLSAPTINALVKLAGKLAVTPPSGW